MLIIAGLGNPTEEYKGTRHNIGYLIITALAEKIGKNFAEDSTVYRANQYLKTKEGDEDIVLTLPLGYMNNSGEAIKQVMDFYGSNETRKLWIVHDDTDLPYGQVKVKLAGTSAGHNGIKSIDEIIGNRYWRIRVGVGKPKHEGFDLARFVLSRFTEEEKEDLPTIIDQTSSYLVKSLSRGSLKTEKFNAKNK